MAIKANIGVSRKLGMPEFSSIQASCNLEIELDVRMLDDDPDAFSDKIRHYYGLAQRAVDDELERLRTGRPAAVEPQPQARPQPPAANGTPEHREKLRTDWDRNRYPERPADRRDEAAPRSGNALFAWLKGQEEGDESLVGLLKWVGAWGKQQGLSWKMNQWTAAQVAGAYAEACAKIREYKRSDELQRDLAGDRQLGPGARRIDTSREGT